MIKYNDWTVKAIMRCIGYSSNICDGLAESITAATEKDKGLNKYTLVDFLRACDYLRMLNETMDAVRKEVIQ